MSEGPELPEVEALAAEHALGVLTAAERAAAERRMIQDPGFAAQVEAWRERFAPLLAATPEVAPTESLWSRIEGALPANDNLESRVSYWRRTAMGALALAAASVATALFIAVQRPVAPAAPPPGQMLNARIDTPAGQHLFVAAYDPGRQAVVVSSLVPAGTDPGHVHQLWLIPSDGKPRSVGFVPVGQSVAIPLEDGLPALAREQAVLAVSVEAPGGSKAPGPTGPVVASGKLSKI